MVWKHKESKWFIRDGRKVRCYLCGKKILNTDHRMYFVDTGYYSHEKCNEEITHMDTNGRRKAIKVIATTSAIAGAVALGADKLMNITDSKHSSLLSKPQTAQPYETVITSQGIILPSLTSDPANPEPGQMWYRSDAGVTAHYDATENRVIYSNRIVTDGTVVTSKGIINGLSVLINDGQDFGPDTMSGATQPSQVGSPYTQTSGIMEVANYLNLTINSGHIFLKCGRYIINKTVSINMNYALIIEGEAEDGAAANLSNGTDSSTVIEAGSSFPNTNMIEYYTELSGNTGTIQFKNLVIYGADQSVWGLNGNINGNTAPTYNVVRTFLLQTKISGCNVGSVNLAAGGGPNIIDNVIISSCGTTVFTSLSVHIGKLELFSNLVNNPTVSAYPVALLLGGGAVTGDSISIYSTGAGSTSNPNATYAGLTAGNSVDIFFSDGLINISNIYVSTSNETYVLAGSNGVMATIGNISIGWGNSSLLLMFCNTMALNIGILYMALYSDTGTHMQTYEGPGNNQYFSFSTAGQYYINIDNWIVNTNPNNSASPYTFGLGGVNYLKINKFTPSNIVTPGITNPPVSGTVYQNTNGYDIEIELPVYASTSGTAGYVSIAKGTTDTPATVGNQYVSGDTSDTSEQIIKVKIPAYWFYEFTASGVTFGTASVFAE